MKIDLAANKERFENLVKENIKRDGIEKVLNWLDRTDFYTAPASTQYHLSVEGGLCQHSLDVYDNLIALAKLTYNIEGEISSETIFNGETINDNNVFTLENITLVALFHDICKANCYVRDFKNVKVNGRWEQQEYWKWDEQFVYGHGTKSVYILQQFMRLYIDEALAIRFHMAGKEDALSDQYERQYAKTFETTPLAVLLHLADMKATWIDEVRE